MAVAPCTGCGGSRGIRAHGCLVATRKACVDDASYRRRLEGFERLLDRQLRLWIQDLRYRPLIDDSDLEAPCVYLLRYRGRHGLYGGLKGHAVVYVGSTQSATRRLGEHRQSLEGVEDLSPAEFWVGLLPTNSVEMSRHIEARIIRLLDPPWNRPDWAGFGSKPQGRVRQRGQRISAWDRLHPGRPWAAGRSRTV